MVNIVAMYGIIYVYHQMNAYYDPYETNKNTNEYFSWTKWHVFNLEHSNWIHKSTYS